MTSDPRMSRRVARLENDTESVYELLTGVSSTLDEHTARFDRIESTLAEHARRLDEHTRRFDEHTRRFDEHTGRFDEHDGRFDRIDSTLDEVLRRLPEAR